MTQSVVHVGGHTIDSVPTGSTAVTLAWTPAVGNALEILIQSFSGDVPSITDNQGVGVNTYQRDMAASHSGSASTREFAFRCAQLVASSGTFTYTISGTAGDYYITMEAEESGAATSTPLDKSATAESTGTSIAPTTAATTQNDEVVYYTMGGSSAGTNPMGWTLPAGYTQIYVEQNAAAHHSGIGGYKIVSTTGAQNGTGTWSVADVVLGGVLTYKASAAVADTFLGQACL